MIVTERETARGLLVTVCDPGLIGETFEEDGISLDVTEDFYDGEHLDTDDVIDSLARASVANIVGTEAVALAIEEGFVAEERVLDVDGTRHAQFLRL